MFRLETKQDILLVAHRSLRFAKPTNLRKLRTCEQKNNVAGCPAFSFIGCDVPRRAAIRLFISAFRFHDFRFCFMSYLSVALQRHSERRRLTQTDLAKLCGISNSYFSRFFSSATGEMSDDHFIAVLKGFATDPQAQAELVAARCMDVRVGPGSELVEIMVKSPEARTKAPSPAVPVVELSHETERAFAWLRSQCPLNPDLEKHLVGYAKLMGMK